MKSKYLHFQTIAEKPNLIIQVVSKSSNEVLGRIHWYSTWRQYTFEPYYSTVWSWDCLKDLSDYLKEVNKQ